MASQRTENKAMQPTSPRRFMTAMLAITAVLVVSAAFIATLSYSPVNASMLQAATATATSIAPSEATATKVPTQGPPPTLLYTPVASADEVSPCVGVEDPAPIVPSTTKFWGKPDQVIDPTHTYCAIITTDKGRMIAQLYPAEAPQNVNAFVFLAQQGFYDNLTWHRVLQDFMAQTGDPLGNGMGGPGFEVPLEVVPSLKYDKPGVIGMARAQDPDSAGSQFFITFEPAPFLDPSSQTQGYTIIGQVVEGLDVLNQIKFRDPDTAPAYEGDPLVSIRIVDLVLAE